MENPLLLFNVLQIGEGPEFLLTVRRETRGAGTDNDNIILAANGERTGQGLAQRFRRFLRFTELVRPNRRHGGEEPEPESDSDLDLSEDGEE